MSKTVEYRTSACQWDGAMPVMAGTGVMSLSTAAANDSEICIPFGGTIVGAYINIQELPDGANAVVSIGTYSDADHFGTYTVGTGDSTGFFDITGELTNVEVNTGDILSFSTDGAATSTGLAAVTLVISSNA